MKITLEALQVIETIARCGTFGLAGEALHKAPSSLSYVVQKLESDLGVTVFDRSGLRVRLTRTGALLVDEGRQLLRNAEDLEMRAKRVETGWETELKIVVDATLPFDILTPMIRAFQAENSHTRLLFSQELLGGSWQALVSNQADLAIAAVGDAPIVQGLFSMRIGETDSIFVVAPTHPLAGVAEPIECSILWQHQFAEIGTTRDWSTTSPALVEGQKQIHVPTMQAKEALLLAGIACGYLPRSTAQHHIDSGALVPRRLCEEPPSRSLYIAWHDKEPGPALSWWLNRKDALLASIRQSL